MDRVERFWRQVEMEPNTGCALWAGTTDRWGYGMFREDQKTMRQSHRVAWEMEVGPIPKGLLVLHGCDTPCCVNPRHLSLGDHAKNMRDRNARLRVARGEQNGHAKLTEEQVRAIRRRYAAGEASLSALSREYGVGTSTIHRTVTRQKWAHLEDA